MVGFNLSKFLLVLRTVFNFRCKMSKKNKNRRDKARAEAIKKNSAKPKPLVKNQSSSSTSQELEKLRASLEDVSNATQEDHQEKMSRLTNELERFMLQLQESISNEKNLELMVESLQKKLERSEADVETQKILRMQAENASVRTKIVLDSWKPEKKRLENARDQADDKLKQIGKLKDEIDRFKKINENQEKTIKRQNREIKRLKIERDQQLKKNQDLKTQEKKREKEMDTALNKNGQFISQLLLKKLEYEKIEKDLKDVDLFQKQIVQMQMYVHSQGKVKVPEEAYQPFFDLDNMRESILKKLQNNLKQIDNYFDFNISKLQPIPDTKVFSENIQRSIDQLIKRETGIDNEGYQEKCKICQEEVSSSDWKVKKCKKCEQFAHLDCLGEWFVLYGKCVFCDYDPSKK